MIDQAGGCNLISSIKPGQRPSTANRRVPVPERGGLYPPYLTSSIVPPGDIVAHGVLPYAPRLTRRPFGVGSSSPLRILRPLSIAGEPGS